MQYIYIFEDGEIRRSEEEPTTLDGDAVDSGVLTIIRFEGTNPEQLTEDGWEVLSKTEVTDGPEGPYHI